MTLTEHAKMELEVAGLFDKDSDYGGMTGEAVMELIEVFGEQGHSGMSASLTRNIFNKLADYKPLTPIQGTDDEWGTEASDTQNKRLFSLSKRDDGTVRYGDAIIWQGEESWDTFGGTVEGISSFQNIKGFPFTPKTFVIDVIREYNTEEYFKENDIHYFESGWVDNDGNHEYYTQKIKDRSQLDEVREYYDLTSTNE